jgi:hypothetical protein
MHLFKFCTNHADLFISSLDLAKKEITYSVRDKETGKLLEPSTKSKLVLNNNQVIFDVSRVFPLELAKHIEHILN